MARRRCITVGGSAWATPYALGLPATTHWVRRQALRVEAHAVIEAARAELHELEETDELERSAAAHRAHAQLDSESVLFGTQICSVTSGSVGGRYDDQARAESFREEFPRQPLNARRVVGALEATGCWRRTALDTMAVSLEKRASLISSAPRDRQWPFTLTAKASLSSRWWPTGWLTLSSSRRHLDLEIPEVRQHDLSASALRETHPSVRHKDE